MKHLLLSSGKRINRAADDAAGLTINEKLTSKLRGITKAQGNIGDALSVIQRTYGGLSTAMENLQNIRELMVKAANGTKRFRHYDKKSFQNDVSD